MNSRLVPVELLFSSPNLISAGAPHESSFGHLAGVPITNIYPYLDVVEAPRPTAAGLEEFHRFEASRAFPRAYSRKTGEQKRRTSLRWYKRLFSPARPAVTAISRDRLFVGTGLFEACAARASRREWIKVEMPDEIAQAWDRRPTAELDRVCRQQSRKEIYTPIMHPSYRRFKYSRRGFHRLDMIRRFLGPEVEGMTLLDIGCNSGYYTFHFCRQGLNATGIDKDAEHLAVAEAQKTMYGLDPAFLNLSLLDFEASQPFDVVLAMTVFWHMLGWGKVPKSLTESQLTAKIERLVGHALFWESGPEPEKEIDLICRNTGLGAFTQLGLTSATGLHKRVFGVFTRSI